MKYIPILMFLPILFYPQMTEIVPAKKGNLWGFIDKNKNFVIPPQYEQAFPFEEYKIYDSVLRKYQILKLAKVYKDKQFKCIDEQNFEKNCINLTPYKKENLQVYSSIITEDNKETPKLEDNIPIEIKNKYESAEIFFTEPTLYLIKKDGKRGLIDANEKQIVPVKFDFIERHRVWVNSKMTDAFFTAVNFGKNASTNYDLNGKIIIESLDPYSPADPYNNFIIIKDKKGKLRIFNLVSRNFINKKCYDKVMNSFVDGKILVERDKKEFYLDVNGKEFIAK